MVKKIVVTVISREADIVNPPVILFQVEIQGDGGVSEESFGDVGRLNAFLKGMTTGSIMVGRIHLRGLSWEIPTNWTEPRGIRWTFTEDDLPKREELDSEGNVLAS